jgi:ABC-type uncharacterized transport system ATPase subunit
MMVDRSGELVAVAGVQGNGQTELIEAIMGLGNHRTSGSVRLGDDAGFSLADNLVLDQVDRAPYSSMGVLKPTVIRETAQRLTEQFDIRAQGVDFPASSLSGGNQQKLVMARALSRPLTMLVASQPTRGVDVGSIELLHEPSPNVTGAPRCSLCPRSWTRGPRSPTGSS